MKKVNLIKILGAVLLLCGLACTPKNEIMYEAPAAEAGKSSATASKRETVYFVYENGAYVQSVLDKAPTPTGGEDNFYRTMGRHISYPAQAREKGIQGTVLVEVVVNESGRLEGSSVKKGIGGGCDQVALNAVRLGFQAGFEPAMKAGKPVKVKYDIPVKFGL